MRPLTIIFLSVTFGFVVCWQQDDRLIRELEQQIADDSQENASLRAAVGLPRKHPAEPTRAAGFTF